jgi:hypothetical protein
MAGVSGSSSTWISPLSAVSGGAEWLTEGFIAQSPWYVFFAITFLRCYSFRGFDARSDPNQLGSSEGLRNSAVSRDFLYKLGGLFDDFIWRPPPSAKNYGLHVRTVLSVTAITPQLITPPRTPAHEGAELIAPHEFLVWRIEVFERLTAQAPP